MTKKTWVGGGTNNASDARNWTPNGVPVSGDLIDLQAGTMNIRGSDLAGDTLLLDKPFSNTAATTLNLSRQAKVSLGVPAFLSETVTVNVQGTDTLRVANATPSDLFLTVNLAAHATLTGNFNLLFGRTVINGGSGSSLTNNGANALHGNGIILNTSVNGSGNFAVSSAQGSAGRLEFGGSVSHGQNVDVGADPGRSLVSQVQIDHPGTFKGSVGLGTNGEVDLMGLTGADSHQLKNDILSIYSGAAVIDRVRMTLPPPPSGPTLGITVKQTSAGVVIDRGPSLHTGTLLPVHQSHGSVSV